MSISPQDYLIATNQLITGETTRTQKEIFSLRQRDISPHLNMEKPLRVLDLANGRLQPQYILLKAAGHEVVGVDMINRPEDSWLNRGYRVARWIYRQHIRNRRSLSLNDKLACCDVASLPFKNDWFDLITSVAAFEHFLDVQNVVSEMHRVMRPGALAWIAIHLFTCLSGAHNITAAQIPIQKIPDGIDAWDHLRKSRLPLTVPLNKWRLSQYVETFSQYFDIVEHYCAVREGEHLLIEDIQLELADYTADELTCLSHVFVIRKPLSVEKKQF